MPDNMTAAAGDASAAESLTEAAARLLAGQADPLAGVQALLREIHARDPRALEQAVARIQRERLRRLETASSH